MKALQSPTVHLLLLIREASRGVLKRGKGKRTEVKTLIASLDYHEMRRVFVKVEQRIQSSPQKSVSSGKPVDLNTIFEHI